MRVRKQLVTLYRKLGVGTRAEALARLTQLDLIKPTTPESDG